MTVSSHGHCHPEESLAFFCLLKRRPAAYTGSQGQAIHPSCASGCDLLPVQESVWKAAQRACCSDARTLTLLSVPEATDPVAS